jgi:hypothetical protein
MILVLDLDGTVINRNKNKIYWADENIRAIFRKIGAREIDEIIVFSFSIFSSADIAYYTKLLANGLEEVFGCSRIRFIPMQSFCDRIRKAESGKYVLTNGLPMDDYTRLANMGKRNVFLMWLREAEYLRGEVMFFDDTVYAPIEFLRFGGKNVTIFNVYGKRPVADMVDMNTGKAPKSKKSKKQWNHVN